ncbi:hypothetical protein HMPREF3188_00712 [Tissierellia bacterium KA00581]|nr:hypothetical protein HMPREF3188_00712 [Tissierellia bacterium KA00581]
MALEKITIATEEKQDEILQSVSNIPGLFIQLIGELAKKDDIKELKDLIQVTLLNFLFQIKVGDNTKESNCKYLLIGVTTKQDRVFDRLKATDTSGGLVDRAECAKCISDRTIKMCDKTFYLPNKTLIVTEFDMYGSESALMLKLD